MIHFSIKAQQLIVVDSLTSEILPYASISYKVKEDLKKVRVSNIGYESKTFQYSSSINDTIYLSPLSYSLQEVNIEAKRKDKFYNLGLHTERRLSNNAFTISASYDRKIAALFIPPIDSDDYIEGVYIPMRKAIDSIAFKIYLLSVSKDGLPKDTILKKTLEVKDFNNRAYIGIREHYLKIPAEGIFIAFEWQSFSKGEQIALLVSEKYDNNYSYLYIKGGWKTLEQFMNTNELLLNFRFGFKMREG